MAKRKRRQCTTTNQDYLQKNQVASTLRKSQYTSVCPFTNMHGVNESRNPLPLIPHGL